MNSHYLGGASLPHRFREIPESTVLGVLGSKTKFAVPFSYFSDSLKCTAAVYVQGAEQDSWSTIGSSPGAVKLSISMGSVSMFES